MIIKIAGQWRTTQPAVKVANSWNAVKRGYTRVAGIWVAFHQSLIVSDSILAWWGMINNLNNLVGAGPLVWGNAEPIAFKQRIGFRGRVGQFLTTPTINFGSSAFSISTWYCPLSISTLAHLFSSQTQNNFSIMAAPNGGAVSPFVLPGTDTRLTSSRTISYNEWSSVIVTVSARFLASTITLYVNGLESGSRVVWFFNANSTAFRIGQGFNGQAGEGYHADTRVYSKELSQAEVTAIVTRT